MIRPLLVSCLVLALAGGLAGPAPAAGPMVDPAALSAHVRFLADDLLEGRGIATRGGALAAAYQEAVFRAAGLEPGAGDGFAQAVPMTAFLPDPEARITFERGGARAILATGEDFAVVNAGLPDGVLRAQPLFVGYGIESPSDGWDDFKGADVRGRLLVGFVNEPGRDDPKRFGGRALTLHGRWRTKLELAARRGAAGMLLIHTDADAGYAWAVARSTATKTTLGLADDPARLAMGGWIREEAARNLLQMAGLDMDSLRRQAERPSFRPVELPVTVEIRSRLASRPVEGRNVVGILPGAGGHPRGSAGTVVLTAHYDHLGIGRAEAGDSIYNGAVDNCTASALLLTLAQAYARTAADSHPTLVFVAADAEEEGLLGSIWQTRHPAVPLERIRGVVTLEMANPWGRTRDLMVIGAPRAAFARWLEPVLAARGMRMIGDLVPEQGFLFRSDQLAWLQAGVPAAWVNGGMDYEGRPAGWGAARHAEYRARTYHHPGDEVAADFDYAGLAQLGGIVTELVQRMAADDAGAWKSDPELAGMKR
jgi:Zn-dependent M28 family amino/carboxypeptidase